MTRGRKPLGARIVENREGSEAAQRRAQVVLETIAGKRSVEEACRELGIGPAAFHKLRGQMLDGAIAACEPGPVGRPARAPDEKDAEIRDLRARLSDLEIDLRAAQTRAELAIAMPEVLKARTEGALKKTTQFVKGPERRPTRGTDGRSSSIGGRGGT